jgi:O-antigen ligase
VAAGASVTRGPLPTVFALGAVGGAAVVGYLATLRGAALVRTATLLAFVGMIAPAAVVTQQTSVQVSATVIPTTTVVEEVLSVGCLAAILLVARPPLFPLSRVERWAGAFLMISLVSSTWSIGATATALKALQLIVVYLLALCVVRLRGKQSINDAVGVLHLVLLSAAAAAVIVPNDALVDKQFLVPVHRLHGVFPSAAPDILGVLAAVAIVAIIGGVGPRWTVIDRRVSAVLLAVYSVELVATRARSPLIVAALGIGVILFRSSSGRRRVLYLMPVVLGGVIAVVVAFGPTITSFLERGQSSQQVASLTGRTTAWSIAYDQWKAHPVDGLGYYAGHRLSTSLDSLYHERTNLDSLWVETLLDTGIVGMGALIGFVLLGLRGVFSRSAQNSPGVCAVATSLLFASFLNPSLQQPGYIMTLFAIVLFAGALLPESAGAPEHRVT